MLAVLLGYIFLLCGFAFAFGEQNEYLLQGLTYCFVIGIKRTEHICLRAHTNNSRFAGHIKEDGIMAKDMSGQTPGGKRVRLSGVLPLATPFLLYIFPIYACNFRCRYCIFSVDKENRGFISDKIVMDFDLYRKCIDDAAKFPDKLKVLRFVGMGEPLLHPQIAKMVEYAVSKDIAATVEVITNASLLTPDMSDALISAGLSRMIVSLQGTTREKYKEVSSVDIEMGILVENLRYFYAKKRHTHLYVKIMDTVLDGKEDERRFYDMFGGICDTIAIEHTVPIYPGVDYGKVLGNEEPPVTQFGRPVSAVRVCPQPFFSMQVNPDGKVVPCFSLDYPEIIGDCNEQSIYEIWNSERFRQFRLKLLNGSGSIGKICANCNIIKYRMSSEDVLNTDDVERLKRFYEA